MCLWVSRWGDIYAGALELLKLGQGLALDIVLANFAAEEGLGEVEDGRAEGLAVAAEEGWNALGVGDRNGIDEGDVAADTQGGVGVGDGDGVVEGGAGRHEGGGGEDAGLVELADGSVDARSEAEVVRVEDEAGRHGVYRGQAPPGRRRVSLFEGE